MLTIRKRDASGEAAKDAEHRPRVAVGEHKKTTIAQQEVITKQVEMIEREEPKSE